MKRACVIGWPIEHSRSPMIHGYWLKTLGIDGDYTKIAVEPGEVRTFLRGLHAAGLEGCNVTVPHKEAAFAEADWRDPSAVVVGAANTVWLEGSRLCVANTDTYGFMTHLSESAPGWNVGQKPVVVLGAGGAARAIVYGFLQAGVREVRVVNRTLSRAEELARHFGSGVSAVSWPDSARAARDAGVLVNTTTLGMAKADPLDFDVSVLPSGAVIADIVYVPLETPLLAAGRRRELRCVDGLGMLLHQAVPGFEKWFGRRPSVTPELRRVVEASIEGT